MKQALIDLGTNSVKCLVMDCPGHEIVSEWSVVTKLGAELPHTGKLGAEAVKRTLQVIMDMVDTLRKSDTARIRIIGTMALREALDASELLDQIRIASSIIPEILSGPDEARLSFEAALTLSSTPQAMVTDIGGGSTELTLGSAERLNWSTSLQMGAVTLSSMFFSHDPVLPEELIRLKAYISNALSEIPQTPEGISLIGVGGSLCTLAAIAQNQNDYSPSLIHGSCLTLSKLSTVCSRLSTLSIREKEKLPGMQKGRGETILAGALLAMAILEHWKREGIIICTQGWRHVLGCRTPIRRVGIRRSPHPPPKEK